MFRARSEEGDLVLTAQVREEFLTTARVIEHSMTLSIEDFGRFDLHLGSNLTACFVDFESSYRVRREYAALSAEASLQYIGQEDGIDAYRLELLHAELEHEILFEDFVWEGNGGWATAYQ